jgi:hypothetical protein
MIKGALSFIRVLSASFIFTAAVTNDGVAQNMTKADLAHPLIGTWHLLSVTSFEPDTKNVSYPYGQHPTGYLQYSAGGHMVVFLSSGELGNAKPPYTDADNAGFYNVIAGYCGTYTVKGNVVTHHVVTAWRPDWVGVDQTRYIDLKGNKLAIRTAPIASMQTGKKIVTTLTWERVE